MKIWTCKIGECHDDVMPSGSDVLMRAAVSQAYRAITGGAEPVFNFSGWGGRLTESERAVVENRPPAFWDLERAISHAVNYHGLDTRLGMTDYAIASRIAPEVQKHLDGETDVQVIEAMTPEQQAAI